MRKLVSATVAAALCMLTVGPGAAQDYRYVGFDAPRGATATVNLRVPLGAQRERARPTYGVTFAYGRTVGAPTLDGMTTTRSIRVADFRFSGTELRNARVASFDLANLDQDRRLNLGGEKKITLYVALGLAAAAVAGCALLFGCFDNGDVDAPNGNSL